MAPQEVDPGCPETQTGHGSGQSQPHVFANFSFQKYDAQLLGAFYSQAGCQTFLSSGALEIFLWGVY